MEKPLEPVRPWKPPLKPGEDNGKTLETTLEPGGSLKPFLKTERDLVKPGEALEKIMEPGEALEPGRPRKPYLKPAGSLETTMEPGETLEKIWKPGNEDLEPRAWILVQT